MPPSIKSITVGDVKMPITDFVVSRNAILGITKSGKTFCAKGIAEQLLDNGIPIIVFDAIGMWRFLKVPSGKLGGKGFPIVVAGGAQPDLPLSPHTAPQIVRAAIQQNISLVIDLYDPKLSKADWRRIVQECFRILLFENKGLRHIFLEEAAEYIPQVIQDGQTYAEVEKLARMGGNASLGLTLISPRSQELNKAVLELCDNVVLLRQRGRHAIDSLEKQMDKLSPDMAKEIALSLPNMTQGDCWVFTENGDKPIRTRSAQISSFHPDRRNPEATKITAAPVDTREFVQALSGKLENVLQEAKANDPAELKREIAKLKSDLARVASTVTPTTKPPEPALSTEENTRLLHLTSVLERLQKDADTIIVLATEIKNQQPFIKHELAFLKNIGKRQLMQPNRRPALPVNNAERVVANYRLPTVVCHRESIDGEVTIGKCERAILTALAQYPRGRSTVQVALLAEYSSRSGGYNNSLGKLRSLGFITRGHPLQITEEGLTALGKYTPLPTGKELAEHWIAKLGKCEASVLGLLIENYPEAFTTHEIGTSIGYSVTSGGFNNALSRLRTLELITRGQPIKASPEFFQ